MPSDAGAPSDELSDADLQQFVVSGFLQLPPSETPAAHAEIAKQIHACGLQDLNGAGRDPYGLRQLDGPAAGNNLLHAAPALRGPAFLESPKLMCALCRLLGPGYRVHPHCRGHLRQRSAKTSMWHVDAYKGLPWCSGRHHEPRWLMLMYYPQETTAEMGPTQLLPGSQYYRGDSDRHHYSRGHIPDFGEQLSGWATSIHSVTGPPGTIVIMHYDLWHRALASASDLPRLMLKFVVSRSAPPTASPVPPPRWPLAYSTDDLELLAAEPLLDFLLAGGLEQGDGAAGGRPASAPKRRFDRQLEASSAAAAPSSEAVDVGDVAASDDAAGLATMLSSFLDANETEGAASHRSDLWSGLDLLNSKGAVEAEQRLFAAAVGLAKEALSTNKQRMPAVLSWLAPRCALAVKRAAGKERRVRFVMDRRPIWKHIWEWLHGYCKDDEEASETTASEAQLLRSLRDELTSGTEPIRMRAAYDLAALPKGGGDILVEVLSDIGDGMSTSVRRTAMYGCIAANRLPTRPLRDIMTRRQIAASADEEDAKGDEEEHIDPVLHVPIADPTRWLSASLLREREGFDAECLLAASNKEAEAVYMATVALANNPKALKESDGAWPAELLKDFQYGKATIIPPPSARLVALESLAHPAIHRHVSWMWGLLGATLQDTHADAGTRAVAARALAHIAAQGFLPEVGDYLRDNTPLEGTALLLAGTLAAAANRDADRYVRGYAFEAIASATSTEQTEVRRRCAERWCPLTTPTSPF